MRNVKSNYDSTPIASGTMLKQASILRLALVLFLMAVIVFGAIPGYLGNRWSWIAPPDIAHIDRIRSLLKTGLTLPGWKTFDQEEVRIGGRKWSVQVMEQEGKKPIMLLLLPQNFYLDKPEVDWMDVNGAERWKTDSYKNLNFTVQKDSARATVEARFFRAWNRRQTFAVLQWYAWLNGGHPAPARWFILDKLAQLRGDRIPWVAVTLKIPIEPLGDLEAARPEAESLAKAIQGRLMSGPLSESVVQKTE